MWTRAAHAARETDNDTTGRDAVHSLFHSPTLPASLRNSAAVITSLFVRRPGGDSALPALAALLFAGALGAAQAATITVTTTNQEVDTDADCSLQEAIFAVNFQTNKAIDPTLLDGTPITTACTPTGVGAIDPLCSRRARCIRSAASSRTS
ncbi:MAG: hypothetical protein IPI73_21465 [Betaproteobacteria bacterium]|nr:hypothetical protein [Betaproteobacteria bacterium]